MQAIETKYLGATTTKGSRIVARCEAGRIVTSKHQMRATNIDDDHRMAAMELITKLGWFGHWIQAAVPSIRNGYVFVCYQRHEYWEDRGLKWKGPVEGFDVYPGAMKDD
jgi:hypothetical protein